MIRHWSCSDAAAEARLKTCLFAEDFDLVLGELLAVVELLDPRVHVHDEVLVQELA